MSTNPDSRAIPGTSAESAENEIGLRLKYPDRFRRHFASDNYSGICPEAWSAMADANQGSVNKNCSTGAATQNQIEAIPERPFRFSEA